MKINGVNYFNNPLAVSKGTNQINDARANRTSSMVGQDKFTISRQIPILNSRPTNAVNSSKNEIEIKSDVVYSLGFVEGKPLKARYFSEGGLETNFSLRIKITGSEVTPEQKLAAKISRSYTPYEHQKADEITGGLSALVRVAEGKSSLESYNKSNYPASLDQVAS